tara:strand:- start:65 stop:823 length:759 start_codon:yes stop_codon:yes gene_type:complete
LNLVIEEHPRVGVVQLTLNRPDKRNALSNALIAELSEAVNDACISKDIRCCVLVGSGGVFSAGADVSEMEELGIEAIDNTARQMNWERIEKCPKPIIAAVEGFAFGGGHELAMVSDFIVAAEDARFGQPEINLGILPGDGATQRLTRVAGKGLAMRMMLTGEPIDAPTAYAAGLVAALAPPGKALEEALKLAVKIAEKNPIGATLVKQAVKASYETTLTAGLESERQAIRLAFARGAHVEGMRKFLKKKRSA